MYMRIYEEKSATRATIVVIRSDRVVFFHVTHVSTCVMVCIDFKLTVRAANSRKIRKISYYSEGPIVSREYDTRTRIFFTFAFNDLTVRP